MACTRSIELLQQLLDTTLMHHNMIHGRTPSYNDTFGDWKRTKVNKTYFFEQTITFAGSTMTVDLNLPSSFQLNRIEQVFSDTTARDFDERVFTIPGSSAYIELKTVLADVSLNNYTQLGNEYKYPATSKLQIYYANFTVGKTVIIKIQLDEL